MRINGGNETAEDLSLLPRGCISRLCLPVYARVFSLKFNSAEARAHTGQPASPCACLRSARAFFSFRSLVCQWPISNVPYKGTRAVDIHLSATLVSSRIAR
jgi:hypothetical protein